MNKPMGFIFLALALIGAYVVARRLVPGLVAAADKADGNQDRATTAAGLPGTRNAQFSDVDSQISLHARAYGSMNGQGGATPYNYGVL